jgi:hypothetical protein
VLGGVRRLHGGSIHHEHPPTVATGPEGSLRADPVRQPPPYFLQPDQRTEIGPSSSPDCAASGGPLPAAAPSSSHPTGSGIEEIRDDEMISYKILTIKILSTCYLIICLSFTFCGLNERCSGRTGFRPAVTPCQTERRGSASPLPTDMLRLQCSR